MLLTLHTVHDQPVGDLATAFGLARSTVDRGIRAALAAAGRRDPLASLAEDIRRLQAARNRNRNRNPEDQADGDEADESPEERNSRILHNARRRRRKLPEADPLHD